MALCFTNFLTLEDFFDAQIIGRDLSWNTRFQSSKINIFKIPMHLLSIRQWKQIFSDAGFMVKSERICIPDDDLKWRRTAGTLFLTGTRE